MKRLVALLISAGLLGLLLWRVDSAALWANLRSTDWWIFSAAVFLFIPQTLTIAWRWKRLVTPFASLPLSESVKMVLAGATMNLVLPGKLGDLTKGWFLTREGSLSKSLGLGIVVFEKMLDVAALALFMLMGTVLMLWVEVNPLPVPAASLGLASGLGLFAIMAVSVLYFVPMNRLPGLSWIHRLSATNPQFAKLQRLLGGSHATTEALRARGARRGEIIGLSLLIWTLHLMQIYLFFLSVGNPPSAGEYFSMVPLAIFIGLLPISIAGFGTRDAALVALLPSLPSSAVLAAALYINLRYIVPALAGIPFLTRYTTKVKASEDPTAKPS